MPPIWGWPLWAKQGAGLPAVEGAGGEGQGHGHAGSDSGHGGAPCGAVWGSPGRVGLSGPSSSDTGRVLHAAPRPLPPAQRVLPGAASGSAGGQGSSPLGRGLGEQGLWVWGAAEEIRTQAGEETPRVVWPGLPRAQGEAREAPLHLCLAQRGHGAASEMLARRSEGRLREGDRRPRAVWQSQGGGWPPGGTPTPCRRLGRGRPASLGCRSPPFPLLLPLWTQP